MENQVPDFEKMAEQLLKSVPKEVAQKAHAFFQGSFIKEGFTDFAFIPWVKRRDDLGHKILSHSLALRDSIEIERANLKSIEISAGNGLKYAAIQNEGGTVQVPVTKRMRRFFWAMYQRTKQDKWKAMALTKKETFTMEIPKRQFIGESHALMRAIDQLMIKKIISQQAFLK